MLTYRESRTIYITRCLAILSVMAAHVEGQMSRDSLAELINTFVWQQYGHVGVICFFFFGGFLYRRVPGDGKTFWSRKVKKLIVPWLFCGGLTYGLTVLLGNDFSVRNLLHWIVGNGSWYYFVTVYLLCLWIFKPICSCIPALWGCVS